MLPRGVVAAIGISRNISEMVQASAKVTIEREHEVKCDLSNSVVFYDIQWPLTQISRSRYYTKANILTTMYFRDKDNVNRTDWLADYWMVSVPVTLRDLWPGFQNRSISRNQICQKRCMRELLLLLNTTTECHFHFSVLEWPLIRVSRSQNKASISKRCLLSNSFT